MLLEFSCCPQLLPNLPPDLINSFFFLSLDSAAIAIRQLPPDLAWLPTLPWPKGLTVVIESRHPGRLRANTDVMHRAELKIEGKCSAVERCAEWLQDLQPEQGPAKPIMALHPRCRAARPWTPQCTEILKKHKRLTLPLHVVLVAGETVALDRGEGKSSEEALFSVLADVEAMLARPQIPPAQGADTVVHAVVGVVFMRLCPPATDGEDEELAAAMSPPPASAPPSLSIPRHSPIPARYSPSPGFSDDASSLTLADAEAARQLLSGALAGFDLERTDTTTSNNSGVAMVVTEHEQDESHAPRLSRPDSAPTLGADDRAEQLDLVDFGTEDDRVPQLPGNPDGQAEAGEEDTDEQATEDEDMSPVIRFLLFVLLSETGLTQDDAVGLMDSHTLPRLALFLVGHLLRVRNGVISALHNDVRTALETWWVEWVGFWEE